MTSPSSPSLLVRVFETSGVSGSLHTNALYLPEHAYLLSEALQLAWRTNHE